MIYCPKLCILVFMRLIKVQSFKRGGEEHDESRSSDQIASAPEDNKANGGGLYCDGSRVTQGISVSTAVHCSVSCDVTWPELQQQALFNTKLKRAKVTSMRRRLCSLFSRCFLRSSGVKRNTKLLKRVSVNNAHVSRDVASGKECVEDKRDREFYLNEFFIFQENPAHQYEPTLTDM